MTAHLSTSNGLSVFQLLAKIHFENALLVLTSVVPRDLGTGRLKEQNVWVETLWEKVLQNFPDAIGCRVLWNTLFFAFNGNNAEKVESYFHSLLIDLRTDQLQSVFIHIMHL